MATSQVGGLPLFNDTTASTVAESTATGVLMLTAGLPSVAADLTTIEALTATTDNVIQSVSSAWASRTPAQLKATLALAKADVGLGSVDNTADTAKPVSTAQQTALDLKAPLASPTFTGTVTLPTGLTGAAMMTAGVVRAGNLAAAPWASGNYYDCSGILPVTTWTGTATTVNRLVITPVFVPNNVTVSEFGINVTTLGASAHAKIAIYSMNGSNMPGSVFWQSPSDLDCSSIGEKTHTGLTVSLIGGTWYWFGVITDVGISMHGLALGSLSPLGFTAHSDVTRRAVYYRNVGSFTVPDPFGTPTSGNTTMFRVTARIT